MAHAPDTTDGRNSAVPDPGSIFRAALTGLLSWILPGLGHLMIGDRARGVVCMAAIVLTFWTGVAIGGVRGTIDPKERSLWFMAQLCTGANAGFAYLIRQNLDAGSSNPTAPTAPAPWVSAEIGVHYTGVAGLLSVLVILDAMSRAERKSSALAEVKRGPPLEAAT